MAIVPLHNCLSVILFYAVFCFGSTAEGHIVYTVKFLPKPSSSLDLRPLFPSDKDRTVTTRATLLPLGKRRRPRS
nr:cadherin-related neuronal receptor variable 9 short nonsplicing form 1 [Danio rerio]